MKAISLAVVLASLSVGAALADSPEAEATAAAGNDETTAKPPEVSIESFQHLPVCRRHVPTGTRIATQRCTTKDERTSALRQNEQDITRQEFDLMRQRQMFEEQARQAARAEALRRRTGL